MGEAIKGGFKKLFILGQMDFLIGRTDHLPGPVWHRIGDARLCGAKQVYVNINNISYYKNIAHMTIKLNNKYNINP
jgi:hypothetical protein